MKKLKLIGISLLLSLTGLTKAQTANEFANNNKNVITDNYAKQYDNWGIVIDSQSVKVYENERKNDIFFSAYPTIQLQGNKTELYPADKKEGKIIIKSGNKSTNSGKVSSPTDSIALGSDKNILGGNKKDSTEISGNINGNPGAVTCDSGKTLNYDDSRTINIDNNKDVNEGKHMNKNRDRSRDLRRDLKRDKNKDRGRDVKRDKNRDRVGRQNTSNRLKIKINLKK